MKPEKQRAPVQELVFTRDPESPEGSKDSKHEGDVGNVKKSLPRPTWGEGDPETEAVCEKCGRSMAGPRRTTGRCLACFPSSKEIIVQPNQTYKIVTRRERRHPSGRVHK